MNPIKGSELKRVYCFIRKIVPENIDIYLEKDYEIDIDENSISVYDKNTLIYYCKFKIK